MLVRSPMRYHLRDGRDTHQPKLEPTHSRSRLLAFCGVDVGVNTDTEVAPIVSTYRRILPAIASGGFIFSHAEPPWAAPVPIRGTSARAARTALVRRL